jgi:hypothetical protein
MRIIIIALTFILAFSIGCKTKQPSGCCIHAPAVGTTTGTVSHQYKTTGCGTVIIVTPADGGTTMTLIPKDKLDKAFDKDGLIITFNYSLLKMPTREGCTTGNMAEITDIAKQ